MAGASTFKTMMRVTLPVMTPILIVVFALNTVRLFESFEIEWLLGVRFNYFVYSTKLFALIRDEVPVSTPLVADTIVSGPAPRPAWTLGPGAAARSSFMVLRNPCDGTTTSTTVLS